jgi:hypothetical protein
MRRHAHHLRGIALAVVVLSSGCSDSTEPIPTPALSVSFGSSTSFTVARGQSHTFPVTISRTGGFSGAVTIAITGLPEGVSVGCSPSPALGHETTLTVAAAPAAPVGSYTATARASGSGVAPQSTLLTINVTQ